MKKQTKKYVRAISVSLGLGLVHYILHQYANLPFVNVGYWIVIGLFLYLAFIDLRIFK